MELFANRPNPFSDETVISFWLPKPGKAILTVTDVSGRVLKRIEENFAGGYHEIAIASTELDASGVLYYQLVTAHQMAARKMVLIRD